MIMTLNYLVACLFELPSSMSGSGDGFGDFEECDKGASSLFIARFLIKLLNFVFFNLLLSLQNHSLLF
jgi:hypothetical protein